MNFNHLIHKNITFFLRYYKLVAAATLITVGVIVGSLAVGDSVRATLVRRVTERLGDTETIIFSRHSFMDEKLPESPLFGRTARGILLTNGFIARQGKLIPVTVWGVNDMSVPRGTAKVNRALLGEMGQEQPDALALRLPATGLIPSGSLFVTETYTTAMRLSPEGVVEVEEGGNISLKNEQALPFNIFVNREELAEALETPGKINLILTREKISAGDLEKAWDYSLSGLSVSRKEGFTKAGREEEFTEITSDRIFLQDEIVQAVTRKNGKPNRLFSYLANSIERSGNSGAQNANSIPYSFVTAMDSYRGRPLDKDEIILSDYSARRLQAVPGDRVRVTYFTSKDLKTLRTDTVSLRVKEIVPLSELLDDKTLSADFPGLSNVERCTEWDSDLPIDMSLITGEDEKYWELYRTAPKAILAYDRVAGAWGNAYGSATAVRVEEADPDLSELRAEMFGIQPIYPRETGLYAAKNGVDFAGLFLALGFFIIVSAVLLMLIPISEMLYRRRTETALLKALGFTRKRIARMLWLESAPVALLSAVTGVVAGLLYTTLILWLLGNVWKGATHTEGFSAYPHPVTVTAGLLTGVGLSLWLLRRTITRNLKEKPADTSPGKVLLAGRRVRLIASSLLSLLIIGVNFLFLHSVALFVLVGVILIGTAAIGGDYLICRNGAPSSPVFTAKKLVWSALYAHKKQAVLSFFALATGVFIVFSVGLNRKGFSDSSQIRAGTGGYSLWCESAVPIYHNMTTPVGREKLSLTELPGNAEILQCLRYSADDASCLNLNKVTTPTVLGVDMAALSASDFRIGKNLYGLDKEAFLRRMEQAEDGVYPALVDATVLTWSLGLNLGDTLHYEGDNGQSIAIRLAGTLPNTIFQGNILIDRGLFAEAWREIAGSEVFLLKVDEPQKEEVKTLLSQALNEYGVRVTTTNDRLRQFNTVTDTYLTIFLTLGGLGLLLGIMSFIIVIRKNLSARREEINLYRTLGFTDRRIERILYRENLLVPLYAIATGVISSLAGVSLSFMNAGAGVWLLAVFFTLFFVACVVVFVRQSVRKELKNTLLSA